MTKNLIQEEVLKILDRKMYGISKEYAMGNMLTKSQLSKLDKKATKSEILKIAKTRAEKNVLLCKKAIKDNPKLFSIHPTRVEQMLNITTTERKRWQSEGKLKVDYMEYFSKYGKSFETPMFNFLSTIAITPQEIESWRNTHKEMVSKNKKQAAQLAAKTRAKNKSIVELYKDNYTKTYNEWLLQGDAFAATMNLCNWTMWVSRLAKTFQIKAMDSIKKGNEYTGKKEKCYQLKELAIQTLLSAEEYLDLSVYIPNKADKVYVPQLCQYHYEDWCEMREYQYVSFKDYLDIHEKEILKCKSCIKDIQSNYYTLYYLKINDEKSDMNFSFHIPYPIGKRYLPNIQSLPKVQHMEQEGLFRFGRPILDEENIVYTEKRIFSELEKALETFNAVYNTNSPKDCKNVIC